MLPLLSVTLTQCYPYLMLPLLNVTLTSLHVDYLIKRTIILTLHLIMFSFQYQLDCDIINSKSINNLVPTTADIRRDVSRPAGRLAGSTNPPLKK